MTSTEWVAKTGISRTAIGQWLRQGVASGWIEVGFSVRPTIVPNKVSRVPVYRIVEGVR